MPPIPRDPAPDSTLALLNEGYRFIPNRCRDLGSDVFATRLMLRRAICAQGEDAARLFYGGDLFTRRGAIPPTTLRLLQDEGSVQTLDGEAHRWRKALFLSVLGADSVARLAGAFEAEWRARLPAWERAGRIVLLDEAHGILCRAACAWAGVPLPERDADRRTREFVAMIDGAGSAGLRSIRGLLRRRSTERWARDVILDVREGAPAPADSPVRAIAAHRDPGGALLDESTAAVELLNLLRPIVAVGRFVVFAAHALHAHPEYRDGLRTGDAAAAERFVQEVRRFYPFFPFIGGRARRPFAWRGRRFRSGAWVLLDLYGTDHDPRSWEDPGMFRPNRFLHRDGNPFDLIPQGGGDLATGHRCPGERATIELTTRAVRLLTGAMTWDVPPQDLAIDLSRMPARPASGFVVANVRAAG